MHAYVIGEVAESRSDKFQVGDLIQGLAVLESPCEFLGWLRAGEQETLQLVAVVLAQKVQLLLGLDTLGYD